jgi:hypothetical protein
MYIHIYIYTYLGPSFVQRGTGKQNFNHTKRGKYDLSWEYYKGCWNTKKPSITREERSERIYSSFIQVHLCLFVCIYILSLYIYVSIYIHRYLYE